MLVEIQKKSFEILTKIKKEHSLSIDIDKEIEHIPLNYIGNKNINLIIIGQDPTIRNQEKRSEVVTVLNLDKQNSLKKYITQICISLGVNLEENVYATNLYKCFFKIPPADDLRILKNHFAYWLPLLQYEIKQFPNAAIITLGEPLLKVLINSGCQKVRSYWDYIGNTTSGQSFSYCHAISNHLGHDFFPFAHQPAFNRNKFYQRYLNQYCTFLNSNAN